MIQIKDPIFLLETHSTDMDETLLVSLHYIKYRFKLATIYNPPRTNKLKFAEKLDKFLNDLNSINCPTVITRHSCEESITFQLSLHDIC